MKTTFEALLEYKLIRQTKKHKFVQTSLKLQENSFKELLDLSIKYSISRNKLINLMITDQLSIIKDQLKMHEDKK